MKGKGSQVPPNGADRTWGAKRFFDVICATSVLIMTSPLMIVVCVIIRMKLGTPVFFRQARLGWRGRPFTLIKFRTMLESVDEDGNLLPDEARLTRLGMFLRRTSLDELPELWNVVRGDMSIVGPRPLLTEYEAWYSPAQRMRHLVRPGLVGPVTAFGRNSLSWEAKFDLDLWYVQNRTFLLDLRLLLLSLVNAVRGSGLSAEGHATMPRFDAPPAVEQRDHGSVDDLPD